MAMYQLPQMVMTILPQAYRSGHGHDERLGDSEEG